MENSFDNKRFDEMPVWELVLGNMEKGPYNFVIPSFQRGYRWEEKQVVDLLNDIKQFADEGNSGSFKYYLQPVVVKSVSIDDNTWEVIDGQQRLTTMLLVLKRIFEDMSESLRDKYSKTVYNIRYTNRPQLDFDNPQPADSIDSYYINEAKRTISEWFDNHWGQDLTGMNSALLYKDREKTARFIWYPIDEKYNEVDNINIFNRLNNGKISLTSSELIKALFILNSKTDANIDTKTLVIEWDAMERKLQDDSFWYFISDAPDGYQTRIDLLFDFVTEKQKEADSDYSYRKFQNLFDYCTNKSTDLDDLWKSKEKPIISIEGAWLEVKRVFDKLIAWYEDNMYYHYVGFLITEGETPLDVYNKLENEKNQISGEKEWSNEDTQKTLYKLIREKFKDKNKYLTLDDIRELEYDSLTLVRRTLLLFNVETCKRNGYQRFAFNKFRDKKTGWDIEHVDSQNESDIQKLEERKKWMDIVRDLLENKKDDDARELREEALSFIKKYENLDSAVGHTDYQNYYKKVNNFFSPNPETVNKNRIGNLTLLDSKTNRSYHDAPFPYKRQCIINIDQAGDRFLPVCTRNLFLRYYSDKDDDISQFEKMRWNEEDMKNYENKLIDMISPIFECDEKEGGFDE